MLAGSPNSNRSIEVEVTNRFVRDSSFSFCDTLLEVNISSIPPALAEFVHSVDDPHPPHPLTFWVLDLLSCAPENKFRIQMEIDREEVVNWLLVLNTPRKLNVYAQRIISHEVYEKACNENRGSNERGGALLECVEAKIEVRPSDFTRVIRILESDPFLEVLVEKLVQSYRKFVGII